MDIQGERLEDGRLKVTIIMDDEEVQAEKVLDADVGGLDDIPDESDVPLGLVSLRRKDYCCTCTGGERGQNHQETVRARSSFLAGLKCAERCKGPFNLRRGRCP